MQITRYLALVVVLVVAGCGGDSSPAGPSSSSGSGAGGASGGGGGGTSPSQLSATIDGQPYNATEILAPFPRNAPAGSLFSIAGIDRTRGLYFVVGAPARVGTHRVPPDTVDAALHEIPPGFQPPLTCGT